METVKEIIERSAEPGYVALDRLERNGYVIVPREPTLEMLAPGGDRLAYFDLHRRDDTAEIWRRMIAVSET